MQRDEQGRRQRRGTAGVTDTQRTPRPGGRAAAQRGDRRLRTGSGERAAYPTRGSAALQPEAVAGDRSGRRARSARGCGWRRRCRSRCRGRRSSCSCCCVVVGGVLGILVVNTKINENAFRLDRLQQQQAALDLQQQQLEQQIAGVRVAGQPGRRGAQAGPGAGRHAGVHPAAGRQGDRRAAAGRRGTERHQHQPAAQPAAAGRASSRPGSSRRASDQPGGRPCRAPPIRRRANRAGVISHPGAVRRARARVGRRDAEDTGRNRTSIGGARSYTPRGRTVRETSEQRPHTAGRAGLRRRDGSRPDGRSRSVRLCRCWPAAQTPAAPAGRGRRRRPGRRPGASRPERRARRGSGRRRPTRPAYQRSVAGVLRPGRARPDDPPRRPAASRAGPSGRSARPAWPSRGGACGWPRRSRWRCSR